MTDPTRTSTLLLTALMVIGLGFFIRASTKDRIEVMQFGSTQPVDRLQQDLISHFQGRAYRQIAAVAPSEKEKAAQKAAQKFDELDPAAITVAGMVSPSIFMTVFLTGLAAVGLACLALILVMLLPGWGQGLFALVALSPLAGVFYWRKSSRPEKVVFKVEPSTEPSTVLADSTAGPAANLNSDRAADVHAKLTIKGHRDELAELKTAFAPVLSAWSRQ